ncbi:MAG: hypothetical protein KA715_08335 [Xanthomonadaceae bacterium]|nr:hypothetical protein [Xanthomonadaceae bacterium]
MKNKILLGLSILALSTQVFAQDSTPAKHQKRKELIAKNARGGGIGATVVTRTLLKQFVFASSWVRGLVGSTRKQEATLAVIDLFIRDENLKKFDEITKKSTSWENYMSDMQDELQMILERVTDDVFVSILRDIDPSIAKDAKLDQIDFTTLDFSKLTPELLASNEDYRRLEAMIGEIDEKQLLSDLFAKGELNAIPGGATDKDVADHIQDRVNFLSAKAVDNIDLGAAVVGQTVITPLLLKGVFGTAAMQAYNWITLPALAGAGISAWQCLRPTVQMKIGFEVSIEDPNMLNLQKFCNKVLNKSAYQILKARSKGLQSGHGTKVWIERTWNKTFKKKKKR